MQIISALSHVFFLHLKKKRCRPSLVNKCRFWIFDRGDIIHYIGYHMNNSSQIPCGVLFCVQFWRIFMLFFHSTTVYRSHLWSSKKGQTTRKAPIWLRLSGNRCFYYSSNSEVNIYASYCLLLIYCISPFFYVHQLINWQHINVFHREDWRLSSISQFLWHCFFKKSHHSRLNLYPEKNLSFKLKALDGKSRALQFTARLFCILG